MLARIDATLKMTNFSTHMNIHVSTKCPQMTGLQGLSTAFGTNHCLIGWLESFDLNTWIIRQMKQAHEAPVNWNQMLRFDEKQTIHN